MSYVPKRRGVRKPNSKPTESEPCYTVHNLPALRRKRTIAYNRISKALEVGNQAISDESQIGLFLSYCQELESISASFQDSHFVILDLTQSDEDDGENDIHDQFDEKYFQVLALQRRFDQPSQQIDDSRRTSLPGIQNNNMRLPIITLPTFSGVIKEWPEFIATYNALIHESAHLSDIEKFHYLVSVLRGDALAMIRTFPVAGEHYSSAYDALKSRFENKRELAFTCWRDLLGVSFKTNNAQDFRRSLDAIDENLTILHKLGLPTQHWDFVLSYNILAKLDTHRNRAPNVSVIEIFFAF